MTKPDATQKTPASKIPDDVVAGEIVVDLAIAAADAESDGFTPPAIIKLAPRGKTYTRDERAYDFVPEKLAARFDKDGIDVPVDLNHSVANTLFGGKDGAVGWIEKLEARADGLYGHVKWLAAGVTALKARTHRFISPTFRHNEFGEATWLHSAALVAAPALAMPAIASAKTTPDTEDHSMNYARLAAALGLTEAASEEAMLTALSAKLENTVEKGVHDATLAKLTAANTELDQLKSGAREEKVSQMMEDALKAKKITPAERANYEALCATDGGLDQVAKLFAAMQPGLKASDLGNKTPPDQLTELTAEDRDVMKLMGQSEEEYRAANGLKAA